MLFTSYTFIGFVLLLLLLYYILPKKWQRCVLLLGSVVFYLYSGWSNMIYLAVTAVSTWFMACRMDAVRVQQEQYLKEHKSEMSKDERKEYKAGRKKVQRKWLLACLLLNFGILAVVKYLNFAISNVNVVLDLFEGKPLSFVDIALPLGISFYTFRTMSYLIDVYRGKHAAEKNLINLALFVAYFPALLQGPISRYEDMAPSLFAEKSFVWQRVSRGLQRVLWGYFKKLVVADRLVVAVNTLIHNPDIYDGAYVFLGMMFYAAELYADFTGGIDITIGISEMFGINVRENFERPFFSKSIAEYWRRWHITMGEWFKDYIFYPVSVLPSVLHFSKKLRKTLGEGIGKRYPVYMSTILTWFVTGVWHGASWNFIVWGLLNSVVILISQEMTPLYERFHARFPKIQEKFFYRFFQIIRTFLLMSSLRVLDCYRNVRVSFKMYFSMFTTWNLPEVITEGISELGLVAADYVILVLGIILMIIVSLVQRRGSVRDKIAKKGLVITYVAYAVLFVCILLFGAYGIGYDSNQFIYNQF